MPSKLEIDIRSLITLSEEMVKDETSRWRLQKYIKSLDTMIEEFAETDEDAVPARVDEYKDRLGKIKVSIGYVESPKENRRSKLRNNDTLVKEAKQLSNSKYYSELRKDLLGGDADSLRQRKTNVNADGGMDQAVKYYGEVQERIAEDMLILTKSLKEQTETANKIIRRDTEIVNNSTQLSDKNYMSLSKESEKLEEHSRKACKCWVGIMIGLVMAIFVGMVLFMKVMKKKTV